jgi:hypothetical protein
MHDQGRSKSIRAALVRLLLHANGHLSQSRSVYGFMPLLMFLEPFVAVYDVLYMCYKVIEDHRIRISQTMLCGSAHMQ